MHMEILGIDIGGSGIKGAPVDTEKGELIAERHKILTPKGADPEPVVEVVADIVNHFKWSGLIGCTFPAIIRKGVAHSAANVSDKWIGTNVEQLIREATGLQTHVLNDADAAGIAEIHFGAGQGELGTIILLTIGTGIGSVLFYKGVLVPNVELGHLHMDDGMKAEHYAADSARKRDGLKWKKWAPRFNKYAQHVEFLFSPDLFIIGGGASKKFHKYEEYLDLQTPIVPAASLNESGIIGAAIAAQDAAQKS